MMETVIKIDDKLYDLIKHYERSIEIIEEENDTLEITLMRAIIKGTPLPKGHGALIDRSEVIKSLFDYHNGKKTIGQCIEDVQTIIEVDWEDEEE